MKPSGSKFVSDMVVLATGQVLSKVLGFLAFAYLARTLGPTMYGSIEYAASLAVLFAMIIDCGLGAVGVREVGKHPEKAGDLAAQIPAARLLIALVVLPLMGLCAFAAGQDFDTILLVWMFGLALIAAPWKQPWLLQSQDRMIGVAIADVLQMGVLYCSVRFLVSTRDDLLWIGGAQLISMVVVAAYYLWYQQTYITPVRFSLSIRAIRKLVQAGRAIGLAHMVWAFHQYSPVMLMMVIVGGDETGWFGACHRLVLSLLTFSFVYHFNLFPEMARRAGKSREALESLLHSSFRVVAWMGCLVALMLSLLSRPILLLLYGESYLGSAPALAVLVWILPITALGGHARWSLIALGHQRYVFVSQMAGALAMLFVGPILIVYYGAAGASTAMVLACLLVWLLAHICAMRSIGHAPPLTIAIPPAALAVAILLICGSMEVAVGLKLTGAVGAFVLVGPLLDNRLFKSLRFLVRAKATEHAAL